MQYKIPQNVQREDTIFLNVTFKQLLILLVGGGISYSIYIILAKSGQSQVTAGAPAIFLAFVTLAVAFLKIRDMNFLEAVLYYIEYSMKPKIRYWKMGAGDLNSFSSTDVTPAKKITSSKAELTETERRNKLLEISRKVNSL